MSGRARAHTPEAEGAERESRYYDGTQNTGSEWRLVRSRVINGAKAGDGAARLEKAAMPTFQFGTKSQ